MQQWSIHSFRGRVILAATIVAGGLVFLFGSAISIALPPIQSAFNASLSGIQWVVNAYTLVLGVFILISGALSDRYGRKRIFLLGAAIFIAGLIFSGTSPTLPLLIGSQVVLGIGAGMMVPVSLAVVRTCFLQHELGRAIGLWTGLATAFAAAGPFLGGAVIDLLGWRSLFFALIPLTLLVMIAIWRFVPEATARTPGTLDVKGATTLGVGLFGILFALIQGPTLGWLHIGVIAAILISILAFVGFRVAEKRAPHPIIPLSIFHSPHVLGANLATLLLYFVLGGMIFFLTLNFQHVQDMSATATGLALLPPIALIALFSAASGKVVDTIGARLSMITGPLFVAFGVAFMFFAGTDAQYFWHFFPGLLLIGIGMVVVIPALTMSALAVADEHSGSASGVNNAISRSAWLFSIAVLGVVAQTTFSGHLYEHVRSSNLPLPVQAHILDQRDRFSGIELPVELAPETREAASNVIEGSFVYSFRWILTVNIGLALLASLISFIFIRGRPGDAQVNNE